jgi:hypothetical protein
MNSAGNALRIGTESILPLEITPRVLTTPAVGSEVTIYNLRTSMGMICKRL